MAEVRDEPVNMTGLPSVDDAGGAFGWPDDWEFKPGADPLRNLVKAGALIAAEIDRLERARAEVEDKMAIEGIGTESWLRERFPDKDWHRHLRTDGRTDLCDGTPSDCASRQRLGGKQ